MLKIAKRTNLLMKPRGNHVNHFAAFRNENSNREKSSKSIRLAKTECARAKFTATANSISLTKSTHLGKYFSEFNSDYSMDHFCFPSFQFMRSCTAITATKQR